MKNKIILISGLVIVFILIGLMIFNHKQKEEEHNERVSNIWNKLEEFPKNDVDYIYLGVNENSCKNKDKCYMVYNKKGEQKINKDKFNINFMCLEDEYSICSKSKILVDDNLEYQVFDIYEYDYDSFLILKTDNNYVIKDIGGQYGEGVLNIYDKEGNLILDIDEVITEFNLVNGNKIDYDKVYSYNPVINNNKLYYVFRSDGETEGLDSLIEFGYIDLSNNKYTKLYTIPAVTYIVP